MPDFRISNVIGAPFKDYITTQLAVRAERGSSVNRSPDELLYLANKTAWVRLASSVNVSKEYVDKLALYYKDTDGFDKTKAENENLARNWVLQAGTSKNEDVIGTVRVSRRSGFGAVMVDDIRKVGESTTLRSGLGFDNAYGLGGVQAQGYRPMPGLESVTIESAGKLGSLRYATVTFKVWNMNQLDVIDALYFRLGYTMLLEWGHVHYFTNTDPGEPGKIGTYEKNGSNGGIINYFDKNVPKEELLYEINAKIVDSDGNYDGMLGVVTNFDYRFNQEGGWDCSLKILGIGSIIESQKINSTYKLPPWSKGVYDNYVNIIKQYILKKRQKILNQQYETKIAIEKSEYNNRVNNIDQTQGFESLTTFANKKLGITNSTFLDNEDDIKKLWANTVITPYFIAPPTGRNDPTNSDRLDFQSLTQYTGPTEGVSGFTDGTALYASQVNGTISLGVLRGTTGWRYPVSPGNLYSLSKRTLDSIIKAGAIRHIRTQGIINTSYLNTWESTTNPLGKWIGDAGVFYPGKSTRSQGPKEFFDLKNGFTIDSTEDSTGGTPILIPAIDIKIEYGSTGKSITEVFDNMIRLDGSLIGETNGQTDPWKTTLKVTVQQGQSSNNKSYIHYDTWQSYFKNKDVVSGPWEVTSVAVTKVADETESTLLGTGTWRANATVESENFTTSLGEEEHPYRADIGLKKVIKITIDANETEDRSSTLGSVDVVVQIDLNTRCYGVLSELLELAGGATAPGGFTTSTQREIATLSPAEERQIERTDGLGSALEAMLAITNYQGVVMAAKGQAPKGRLTATEIVENVGDLLTAIENAPLKGIFKQTSGKIELKKEAELQQDIAAVTDEKKRVTDPYLLGLKGYNTALMSGQINKKFQGSFYDQVDLVNFDTLLRAYVLNKELYTSGTSVESGDMAILETPVYIDLGFLLFFINNMSLLYDSTKKGQENAARPHFYIDYHPTTNLCLTAPSHLSVDPTTCLIPYKGSADDYLAIFDKSSGVRPKTPALQGPGEVTKNLIPAFVGPGAAYQGHTMRILLNTQYLLDVIKQTVDKDNHNDVYFRPFMDRVLADINKATGDINAFRLGYIDASNTAAVLDDQAVPPHSKESSANILYNYKSESGRALLPIFGLRSIARDLTFETNISTKMSSMIAIAARGTSMDGSKSNKGSTQSTDASNLHWLSDGLFDRVIQQADDITQVGTPPATPAAPASTSTTSATPSTAKSIEEVFNEHILTIYSKADRIDRSSIAPSRNYYIQGLTKVKADDVHTQGSPVIPMNLNFTTDGIAGINMGNVFLVPNEYLPISLRGGGDGTTFKFGYMVMGITHNIQSNQWTTTIKGQMIKLRDETPPVLSNLGKEGGVTKYTAPTDPTGPTDPFIPTGPVDRIDPSEVWNYIRFRNDVLAGSKPLTDWKNGRINPETVLDAATAAKAANLTVIGTTASTGHGAGGNHWNGSGFDLAQLGEAGFKDIRGAGGATNATNGDAIFRARGNSIVAGLKQLGYRFGEKNNPEPRGYFWQTDAGGNHWNHIHLSNLLYNNKNVGSGLRDGKFDISGFPQHP